MRAGSYLGLLVVVACGGRGLDDSIYDEGGSDGGSTNAGETSLGGRAASGGRANMTSGGRRNSGGVTGTGGRVATSGGSVGSGGAATTPPESCRRFCKELVADCGIQLQLNDPVCRSTCEQGFTGSSACESRRIEALACIEAALAQPMTTCDDVARIMTRDCGLPLFISATCGR